MGWPPALQVLVVLARHKLVVLALHKLVVPACHKLAVLVCHKLVVLARHKALLVCPTAPLASYLGSTWHLHSTWYPGSTWHLDSTARKLQALQVVLVCKGRLGRPCGCEAFRSERRFRTYTRSSWATATFQSRVGLGQTLLVARQATRGSLSRQWRKRLAR